MFKDLYRFIQLVHILLKSRLDNLIKDFTSPSWFLIFLLYPWRVYSASETRGERICKALEEAGPIFIKFGQLLSTRPDLIPQDIAKSLAKLRNNLEPFSSSKARKIIENELGDSIGNIFSTFEEEPIAAASIAQVYKGKLSKNNHEVAVKVVRPNISKIILRDISLMKRIAKIVVDNFDDAKRLKLYELVEEYEYVINTELDMRIEASNMKQTKLNFTDNDLLYVPEVYIEYTTQNVLTMERVSGTPIDQIETLQEGGIDLKLLSERGVEIFLKQVFIDNFFHADMHPGNIFVDIRDKSNPIYVAVDYAIVSSLSEEEQFQIGRMLLALIARNFKEIASIIVEAKWVNAETDINKLETTIRVACEPIFEQPLEKIKYGELLLQIFDSARKFNLNMQPSLMLLQKTLINIEGLGKQLYPKLDFWSIAKPFLQSWISERYDPSKITEWARENAVSWIEKARKFPERAESALAQINKLEDFHIASKNRHNELIKKIDRGNKLINISLLLILAAIISYWIMKNTL